MKIVTSYITSPVPYPRINYLIIVILNTQEVSHYKLQCV
jgi:hypothetical protein